MASDFFVFLPKNFPLQAWNSNNIEPAHIVTAQFSIIYKSFKKVLFQKRSHAAVENNSDKTSQISWLNSSTKLDFFRKNFSQMFPTTRGNNFCPPAEKHFFKNRRTFSQSIALQTLNSLSTTSSELFNSIFRPTTFLYKMFLCTPRT